MRARRVTRSVFVAGGFDIQVNGYAGGDFCSRDLTLEQCRRACDELAADGADGILATVITDSIAGIAAKLARLVEFRERDPLVARMIAGFHVEGPFLSRKPGCPGAHDPTKIVPATVDDAKRLVEAGGGLLRLVTLAPECDAGLATTAYLARQGITVSAGHCDPSLDELAAAIDAGLTMVTHLGNGCALDLPRHDNFIQRALFLHDRLWICYIPDGVHVPWFALANYLTVSGLDRSIMVTDAIVVAKLPPGRYAYGEGEVEVDTEGVARRPGLRNLAGSTISMRRVRENLALHLGLDKTAIDRLVSANPRRAVGLDGVPREAVAP
ncbi:MAG: N-acetylglucosamine-6-phosphate deacetylase [Planctomycetaceae bacterium]